MRRTHVPGTGRKKSMRTFLHIISIGLLLPSLLFASAFVLLGYAISDATPWQIVDRLLAEALWLMPWGIVVLAACLIAMIVGGFFLRTRWLVASCVAALSAASAMALVILSSGHFTFGQWLFLLPGFLALAISSRLAYLEWPGNTGSRPVT